MKLAEYAEQASKAAAAAVKLSDGLAVELTHVSIKKTWPTAISWSRQFEVQDGFGCWYLTEVKLNDGNTVDLYPSDPTEEHESMVTALNDIVDSVYEQDKDGSIRTLFYTDRD